MKRVSKKSQSSGVGEKAAHLVARQLLTVQERFANCLQVRWQRLHHKAKVWWFAAFCILFGFCSLYAFLPLFRYEKGIPPWKSTGFSVPGYVQESGSQLPAVTGRDVDVVQRFLLSLDSLRTTTEGKKTYDSLLQSRPGLLDSLVLFNTYYSSSIK